MAATSTKQTRLSDEDLRRMLKLIKDSDSVELKLTVEPAGQTSAVAALMKIDQSRRLNSNALCIAESGPFQLD